MKKILVKLFMLIFKPKDKFGLPVMDISLISEGKIMNTFEKDAYRQDFVNDARGKPGGLQGDVGLIKLPKKPSGKLTRCKNNIVAYGEVTGHHHVLDAPTEVFTDELGTLFALVPEVSDETLVRHHEHGAIILDPGEWYQVDIQQEYDGAQDRRVLD